MTTQEENETAENVSGSTVFGDTVDTKNFTEAAVSNHRTLADVAYQFCLGAALGLVVAGISLAISMPDFQRWNLLASVAVVLVSGLLSASFGKHFLSRLISFIESFPPIA
ncbi:MAG: hypothetical protein AAGJ95_09920 [Cyanobacteria bacterium J06554_11]